MVMPDARQCTCYAQTSSRQSGVNSEAVNHSVAGDVAAVAVALKQSITPEFKSYQQQVLANAKVMAKEMMDRGHTIVSGKEQSFVASMFQISLLFHW